jgi:cytochrome oxidase Cu insertion factor (SCO1/SenC/PrrC family)
VAHPLSTRFERRESATIGAMVFIAAVTAAWWLLALWPVPGEAPVWLARARTVCFGVADNGLPAPTGWMVLIGEPVAMIIALMIIAGDAVPGALRGLMSFGPGRIGLAGTALCTGLGLVLVGARVARATDPGGSTRPGTGVTVEQLGTAPPALQLTDQLGDSIALEHFRGRVVLVAFVYGHCTTICPMVVGELKRVRDLLADRPPVVLAVTIDPWRDTPARLRSIAEQWALGADDHILGGTVETVEATLDRWRVPRARDALTGEITHDALVSIVGPDGKLAYRVSPNADTIVSLVRTLD